MEKKLIATDFDGTFCRNGEVDPADVRAIAAWRAAGGYFGFVTGRSTDFFDYVKTLGVEVDFHLLYNGALLAAPDGRTLKEYLIPRTDFAALTAFFRSLPDAAAFSEADGRPFYHQYYATFENETRALEVADAVNRRFGERVTAFVNGPHVNIGKKGSGKTQGVFDALSYFGLPADAAAVFGDDYNDLDMIVAHSGWAVSTARPAVLAKAPHVCASVGAAALELLASGICGTNSGG